MEKLVELLSIVKKVCFSDKIEQKKLTDPSHDVTDDFSIQGKVLQQLRIPWTKWCKRAFPNRIKTWRDMLPNDQ